MKSTRAAGCYLVTIGGDDGVEDAADKHGRSYIKRDVHRLGDRAGGGRPAGEPKAGEQPGERGRKHSAKTDEEALHGETDPALLRRQQVADEGPERLHADIDRRIEHPEESRRHP